MLHLLMVIGSLGLAIGLRLNWRRQLSQSWRSRWHTTLISFALPPLVLLTTAIALLWMGPICHMARHLIIQGWSGLLTYGWSWGYCAILLLLALQLMTDGGRSIWCLRQYPKMALNARCSGDTAVSPTARLIPAEAPFIAQVGLWRPQLVISQGLLDRLAPAHLAAVLCHEAAHRYYADTIWFAGLGLLRRISGWLPQTAALWEELLLLRELRADRWAAQRVDPLLLAEALFTVVSAPLSMEFGVAFNEAMVHDRLSERVDALLAVPSPLADEAAEWQFKLWAWGLVLLPLLTIVLHH
jgi:Zn-dependent protease with chaperone function